MNLNMSVCAAVVSVVSLCSGLCPGSVGGAAAAGGVGPVTVEIDTATGHILLEAWIEGRGPYWFVLDTGNQQTTVFEHVARDASLELEPHGEMGGAGAGSLTVHKATGGARVGIGDEGTGLEFTDDLVVVLPDEAQLPPFNGKEVAGFLGASLIERFMTTVDYGEGTLSFAGREGFEASEGAVEMAMSVEMGFPCFTGWAMPSLNGEAVERVEGVFLLDLGASYTIDIEHEQARARGLVGADDPDQKLVGSAQGIDGVPFEIRSTPLVDAFLGGVHIEEDSVLFMTSPGGGPPIENLVGNVGGGLFAGDRITLDYEGGRLIWEDR